MTVTAMILIIYAFYFAFKQWNSFNLGLMLMIFSLVFRIILEFYSIYRKESRIISMSHKSYHTYLKKYYKIRLWINYLVTPVCIAIYIIGFCLLLPYFKDYFSAGFYTYILISGILSILFATAIIMYSIIKEQRFLKQLK